MRRLKRHPAFRLWKKPCDIVKNSLPNAWRLATQRFRHLPTTVIVGAQKAGTTQLYAYLVTHPRCFGGGEEGSRLLLEAPGAVGRLVSIAVSAGVSRELAARARDRGVAFVLADAERDCGRCKQVLPKARVIVLLARSGVAGVFALSASQDAASGVAELCGGRGGGASQRTSSRRSCGVAMRPNAAPMLGYVARGYYALQLELLDQVYPRNSVLMIDSASCSPTRSATCERVFDFMGLEASTSSRRKVYNRGYYQRENRSARGRAVARALSAVRRAAQRDYRRSRSAGWRRRKQLRV